MISKPSRQQFPRYFEHYVSLAPDSTICDALTDQMNETIKRFSSYDDEFLHFRYQENKWTVLEVFGHCMDVERIFAYRALRFSRKDKTPCSGFDDEQFIMNSHYNTLKRKDILNEYIHLRKSNIQMFENVKEDAWDFIGISSGEKMITSAIPFIIYGHQKHHENVIKERYIK